jgi:hypothetical protein
VDLEMVSVKSPNGIITSVITAIIKEIETYHDVSFPDLGILAIAKDDIPNISGLANFEKEEGNNRLADAILNGDIDYAIYPDDEGNIIGLKLFVDYVTNENGFSFAYQKWIAILLKLLANKDYVKDEEGYHVFVDVTDDAVTTIMDRVFDRLVDEGTVSCHPFKNDGNNTDR